MTVKQSQTSTIKSLNIRETHSSNGAGCAGFASACLSLKFWNSCGQSDRRQQSGQISQQRTILHKDFTNITIAKTFTKDLLDTQKTCIFEKKKHRATNNKGSSESRGARPQGWVCVELAGQDMSRSCCSTPIDMFFSWRFLAFIHLHCDSHPD